MVKEVTLVEEVVSGSPDLSEGQQTLFFVIKAFPLLLQVLGQIKAKDLLLFRKLGRCLFYVYRPSFCGQIS